MFYAHSVNFRQIYCAHFVIFRHITFGIMPISLTVYYPDKFVVAIQESRIATYAFTIYPFELTKISCELPHLSVIALPVGVPIL